MAARALQRHRVGIVVHFLIPVQGADGELCRAVEVGPVHEFLAELGGGLVRIDGKGIRIAIQIAATGERRDAGRIGAEGKLAVVG